MEVVTDPLQEKFACLEKHFGMVEWPLKGAWKERLRSAVKAMLLLLLLFKRQLLDEKNSHGSEGRKSIKIAPKNSLM